MLTRLPDDLLRLVIELCGPAVIGVSPCKAVHREALRVTLRTLERAEKRRGKATIRERTSLSRVYCIADVMRYVPRVGYPCIGSHYISGVTPHLANWMVRCWERLMNQSPCTKSPHRERPCERLKHKKKTFLIYPMQVDALVGIRHDCSRSSCSQHNGGLHKLLRHALTYPEDVHMFGVAYTSPMRNEYNDYKTGQIDGVIHDPKHTFGPELYIGQPFLEHEGYVCFRCERWAQRGVFHIRHCFHPHQLTFFALRRYESFSLTPILRRLRIHYANLHERERWVACGSRGPALDVPAVAVGDEGDPVACL